MKTCLQATCLKPSYPLRRQMMISYGVTAVLTIAAVVVLSTLAARSAGTSVKDQARDMLRAQIIAQLQVSSRYTAEMFTQQFGLMHSTSAILAEVVRDRIVNYPNQGYEMDEYVPFVDTDTGRRKYPLQTSASHALPQDWNIPFNVNESNIVEQFQERAAGLLTSMSVMSASGVYMFQGNCNPNASSGAWDFYPNCTAANNDIVTGGVVYPVSTNRFLESKSRDIVVFMKALYESVPDVTSLQVFYHNSGAGSVLAYPATVINGADTYLSIGCDWMKEINRYTGLPLATDDEIARCRPAGTVVNARDINGLERAYCRDQALNAGLSRTFGPLRGVGIDVWWLTFGQAVFDRASGHYIACTASVVTCAQVDSALRSTVVGNYTDVALVRMDGTVVTGGGWDYTNTISTVHISETYFMDNVTFQQASSVIDWSQPWSPDEAGLLLGEAVFEYNGTLIQAYPIPSPPLEYDPVYRPDFLVLFSIQADVLGVIASIQTEIDSDLSTMITRTIIIGLAGILVLTAVIWGVSQVLTLPLAWMGRVSSRIVNHKYKSVSVREIDILDEEGQPSVQCAPRTEIADLVTEFTKMVHGFSGEGPSRVAKARINEIPNTLARQTVWEGLPVPESPLVSSMNVADDPSFRFIATGGSGCLADDVESSSETKPTLSVLSSIGGSNGRNTFSSERNPQTDAAIQRNEGSIQTAGSALFRWIFALIIVPMILTNLLICSLVARDILRVLPKWLDYSQSLSLLLEVHSLIATARLAASRAQGVLSGPVRDVNTFTRVTAWLLFDALNRSEAFEQVEIGMAEECKIYPDDDHSCPFFSDHIWSPCDCAWDDIWGRQCFKYGNDSRVLQRPWAVGQSQDADPVTGVRNNSNSYPKYGNSPQTTLWWSNVSELPGSWKGSSAAGFATTYDRIRVGSALSTILTPLYNYPVSVKNLVPRSMLGLYVAYDADGMFMGYAGCNYNYARFAHFQSNNATGAYEIRPDLCPLGKYGYDPRCRPWYATGTQVAQNLQPPLYITPPYIFAVAGDLGMSVGSPLINPLDGTLVGQTIMDLSANLIASGLPNNTASYFYFIMSPGAADDANAVAGPGYAVGDGPRAIADVVLPYDSEYSPNTNVFADIISSMKQGLAGEASFQRTMADGSTESLHVSFAPVYGRALQPLNPADFERGSNASQVLLFSWGVARVDSDLRQPYTQLERDINASLRELAWIYLSVVGAISVVCIIVTIKVSLAVTSPMINLVHVVRFVNVGKFEGDLPPSKGGSREVHQVYNSFVKLYRIVRASNTAFFSGSLKWAYFIVRDALGLFESVSDGKATAIASNNLGNTLFGLVQESNTHQDCYVIDGICCVRAGLDHFSDAIEIATLEFNSTHRDDIKAGYACQLANRHFNRAMLYLSSPSDPCSPRNARELGYRDLQRARELDDGVLQYWLANKLALRYSDLYFDRLLRRLHGLTFLSSVDHNIITNVWDIRGLLEEADQLLSAAWEDPSAPLFREMTRVGRLQQLEGVLVKCDMIANRTAEAVCSAVRMLAEDDYLIETSFVAAAEVFLKFTSEGPSSGWSKESIALCRSEVLKMLKHCKTGTVDTDKTVVFAFELSDRWSNHPVLDDINARVLFLYDECCRPLDNVGVAAFSSHTNQRLLVDLGPKSVHAAQQRSALDWSTQLTCGTNRSLSLFFAVQMVLDHKTSHDRDSFVVLISDGSLWDSDTLPALKQQIERTKTEQHGGASSIHLLVLGLEVLDPSRAKFCQDLCTISKRSCYLETTAESMDTAFDQLSDILSPMDSTIDAAWRLGLTMERF